MLPFLQDVQHGVSEECMELVTSWQCVVSSMGDALCMGVQRLEYHTG